MISWIIYICMYVRIVLMLDMISWIIYMYVRIMLEAGYDRLDHLYVFVYASCWMLDMIGWIICMYMHHVGCLDHVSVYVLGRYYV